MNVGGRLFPYLERALDQTAKRQQVLSSNLANLDTPGYRAKDVQFEDEMGQLSLETSSPLHAGPKEDSSSRVYEVGTKAKDNGNTVDLDREMTELSKNGLEYVALVQYLNQKLRTLRSAIIEGGKG